MILKKSVIAGDLWLSLENMSRDNKNARAIQLDSDLHNIEMGDHSITTYCQRLKTLFDLLFNIDVIVPEKTLVIYMVNSLSDKFEQIGNIIQHHNPFLSFLQARSMLFLVEQRLSKTRTYQASHNDHFSSPTIFYSAAHMTQRVNSTSQTSNPNFGRQNNSRHERSNNRDRQ